MRPANTVLAQCHSNAPHYARGLCRPCYAAEQYVKHHASRRAQQAAYRAEHPEKTRELKARYYTANRERLVAKQAAYAAGHRDQIREYMAARHLSRREEARAYNASRKEHRRALWSAWADAHREELRAYRLAHKNQQSLRSKNANAKKRGVNLCSHESCAVLGAAQLAWQTNEHICYLCGTQVWRGVNLHMDHVQPVSRGGVHCADNLRPSCADCNLRKHAKTPDELRVRAWRHVA
jgi:5-methylcytosine-specific restriction endonuclease McrA